MERPVHPLGLGFCSDFLGEVMLRVSVGVTRMVAKFVDRQVATERTCEVLNISRSLTKMVGCCGDVLSVAFSRVRVASLVWCVGVGLSGGRRALLDDDLLFPRVAELGLVHGRVRVDGRRRLAKCGRGCCQRVEASREPACVGDVGTVLRGKFAPRRR